MYGIIYFEFNVWFHQFSVIFGFQEQAQADKLEEQIILADSQVCVALLTFLQQDLSSYVKGGWVLRKAWKVYQHTYSQILQLYRKTFGCNDVPGMLCIDTWHPHFKVVYAKI
jgi:hypothetical protein